jgi:hypothetical protein
MNRFEQLIEYVINDEEAKARELFHDIVVEKAVKSMKISWLKKPMKN